MEDKDLVCKGCVYWKKRPYSDGMGGVGDCYIDPQKADRDFDDLACHRFLSSEQLYTKICSKFEMNPKMVTTTENGDKLEAVLCRCKTKYWSSGKTPCPICGEINDHS